MSGLDVLQVVTDTDRRGAQVFATDLHRALAELGHRVETVALTRGDVGGLDLDVLGPRRLAPAAVRALRARSRRRIVVAHGSSTLAACVLAGLGGRRPFVYRQISDSVYWASTPLRRLRVGMGLRRANRVVALSEAAKRTLVDHVKAPPDRIDVIPNGVPAEGYAPADAEARRRARERLGLDAEQATLLYIGALVPEKGVDLAIEAVASLEGRAQLLVVGDGPSRSDLERRAAALPAGTVSFTGSLRDAAIAYAASDVVLLPSRGGDSMPATLVEAGFCGLPAVTTDVGSITDIVVDGGTGLVVAPGDGAAFAAAVRQMVGDRGAAAAMGEAARRRCLDRFEIRVVGRAWARVLSDVIEERPAGRR